MIKGEKYAYNWMASYSDCANDYKIKNSLSLINTMKLKEK